MQPPPLSSAESSGELIPPAMDCVLLQLKRHPDLLVCPTQFQSFTAENPQKIGPEAEAVQVQVYLYSTFKTTSVDQSTVQ